LDWNWSREEDGRVAFMMAFMMEMNVLDWMKGGWMVWWWKRMEE
jgi:hypothetical protein